MTITLNLSTELEKRLKELAEQQGQSIEQSALQVLEQQVLTSRNQQAIALLKSWVDDPDEQEQQETGAYLIRALDEDRPSERKLFPPELKGITW